MSVDLSLFTLLYNTNFTNKLKFNDFFKLKTKNNTLTIQTFYNPENQPTFHSEERLVNLAK